MPVGAPPSLAFHLQREADRLLVAPLELPAHLVPERVHRVLGHRPRDGRGRLGFLLEHFVLLLADDSLLDQEPHELVLASGVSGPPVQYGQEADSQKSVEPCPAHRRSSL